MLSAMSCYNGNLTERIERAEQRVIELEDAIDDIIAGRIYSYTLKTGQSSQTVTKQTIGELHRVLDAAEDRLRRLYSQANNCGSFIARPGW